MRNMRVCCYEWLCECICVRVSSWWCMKVSSWFCLNMRLFVGSGVHLCVHNVCVRASTSGLYRPTICERPCGYVRFNGQLGNCWIFAHFHVDRVWILHSKIILQWMLRRNIKAGFRARLRCYVRLVPKEFGYKKCGPEGRWEGRHPGDYSLIQGYTNYTECYTLEAKRVYDKIFRNTNPQVGRHYYVR